MRAQLFHSSTLEIDLSRKHGFYYPPKAHPRVNCDCCWVEQAGTGSNPIDVKKCVRGLIQGRAVVRDQ